MRQVLVLVPIVTQSDLELRAFVDDFVVQDVGCEESIRSVE